MKKDSDLLKKLTILEECLPRDQEVVVKFFKTLMFRKGDSIFKQGDTGRHLYIVKKGLVGSYTELSDGNQIDLARYSPGKFFGEMALTEAHPRTTTCYALSDSELLAIDFMDFYRLIWTYPEIGIKILKAIMRYMIMDLREADKFLTTMAIWGENARLRAITDELTGLYNKRFFEESLELAIIKAKQNRGFFSIIMFDIDNFHNINKALGIKTGDKILKNIAACIKSVCTDNAVISRLGGDEFAVLLPDLSVTGTLQVAKKFKETLENTNLIPEPGSGTLDSPVTASIGIAEYPDHGDTITSLKEAADKALYNSKKTGKNKIMCIKI